MRKTIKCPQCGAKNPETITKCNCGYDLLVDSRYIVKEKMNNFVRYFWYFYGALIFVELLNTLTNPVVQLPTRIVSLAIVALILGVIINGTLGGLRNFSSGSRIWFLIFPILVIFINIRGAQGILIIREVISVAWAVYIYSFLLKPEVENEFQIRRQKTK